MMVHAHVHSKIVDRRFTNGPLHRIERVLVRELMRWEALRLVMHLERVDVLERLRLKVLRELSLEAIELRGLLSSMQGTF